MILSLIFAVIGLVLTGLQATFIYLEQDTLCFNDGCEIADSLTRVPPLYFNIVGFVFFLIICFGLLRARKGSDLWRRFVGLLLLAALAAEAVLVSFQLFITQALCYYCLILFALIALANFFLGIKQIFRGIVIFSAVMIGFASLDFKTGARSTGSLDRGTISRLSVDNSERQLYLFFSSSCKYCEHIIGQLQEENSCNLNFNPIEPIDSFIFEGATRKSSYRPEINKEYLRILGIEEIPVLLVKEPGMWKTLLGGQAISEYLDLNCTNNLKDEQTSDISIKQSNAYSLPPSSQKDGCSYDQDCEDPANGTSAVQ
ncbi:MAG: hypothetical protein HKP41_21905 [Desulfobacterales bacterium]|nr:hypothetical protein [Deltaproteobacteria bacterium]NNK97018.1 hypothetical protein [Desulfobacterales bacterium]